MNPTPEVSVESDANREHRHGHTDHIKSEQISLAKCHTDVQCQMVAASEYESPGVLCITRLTTDMKYVSASLLGSLFANFDQFGTRGPTGPADRNVQHRVSGLSRPVGKGTDHYGWKAPEEGAQASLF
jgi:hypothetical protein